MNKNQRINILKKISQEAEIESTTPINDMDSDRMADSIFERIWDQTVDAEITKLQS